MSYSFLEITYFNGSTLHILLVLCRIHLRCLKQKRAELGNNEAVNQRLGVQWNENIYVHLIPPERIEEAKEGKQAVFVRRFRPSCVEVSDDWKGDERRRDILDRLIR